MEGTPQVKRSKRVRRLVVSADGHGMASHAGVGLLREMAEYTGLVEGVTDALIGTDLICWTKKICFADVAELARCEIAAFRYRVLHVAARLTRSARQLRLRIDKTWRWAAQIAEGFDRLRAAFA